MCCSLLCSSSRPPSPLPSPSPALGGCCPINSRNPIATKIKSHYRWKPRRICRGAGGTIKLATSSRSSNWGRLFLFSPLDKHPEYQESTYIWRMISHQPHGQSLGNIFKPVSEAVELWDRNTKVRPFSTIRIPIVASIPSIRMFTNQASRDY